MLGPDTDGGYHLVALREPHDVFTAIPMGAGGVLAATVERARRRGLRVALEATLTDLDQAHDLEVLAGAPRHLARSSRAAVAALGVLGL